MYALVFDEEAVQVLEKLPKKLRERIVVKLRAAKENPHHFFVRLKGRGDYKLRVGDYRIIADIDDKKQQITITLAGHRKNVYT